MRDLLDYLLANVKIMPTPKARKFIVAFTGASAVLGTAVADGVVTGSEVGAIVVAFTSAFAVFFVPNKE